VPYRIQRQGLYGVLEQRNSPVGKSRLRSRDAPHSRSPRCSSGAGTRSSLAQVQAKLGLQAQDASKRVAKPVRSDLTRPDGSRTKPKSSSWLRKNKIMSQPAVMACTIWRSRGSAEVSPTMSEATKAIQAHDVIAMAKHYAVNDQEYERIRTSVEVDNGVTLHEPPRLGRPGQRTWTGR
jgi:hypothetical protein